MARREGGGGPLTDESECRAKKAVRLWRRAIFPLVVCTSASATAHHKERRSKALCTVTSWCIVVETNGESSSGQPPADTETQTFPMIQ
jgi:hypothetical protein